MSTIQNNCQTQNNRQIQGVIERASSSSAAQRRAALETWVDMDRSDLIEVALELIGSPYRDVREDVVSFCCEEYSNDRGVAEILCDYISKHANDISTYAKESLLIWLASVASYLTPEVKSFVGRCFDDADDEIRYRAFCLAEYAEESSEAYWARVEQWLGDEDEDFRIVAVQAIERRVLQSGAPADEGLLTRLESQLSRASDTEGFHIRLALLRLCAASERAAAVRRIIGDIEDARFSYPAIDAVMKYGSKAEYYGMDDAGEGNATRIAAIEALLRVSRGIFGEPTVRTIAAATAAQLGSAAGRELLESFSRSRRGNASYAQELLSSLRE